MRPLCCPCCLASSSRETSTLASLARRSDSTSDSTCGTLPSGDSSGPSCRGAESFGWSRFTLSEAGLVCIRSPLVAVELGADCCSLNAELSLHRGYPPNVSSEFGGLGGSRGFRTRLFTKKKGSYLTRSERLSSALSNPPMSFRRSL